MIEAKLIRRADGLFQAATAYDAEILGCLKMGQGYNVKITQGSNRSLQHHRLFFGVFLKFAFDYWQPSGGLLNESEMRIVGNFAKWLDKLAGTETQFQAWGDKFSEEIGRQRAEKLGAPPARSMEQFRYWLVVQAGYFDVLEMPSGVRKVPKSISFAKMSQEEFNVFYQRCFDVVWNMVLKHHFENQEAAQAAIDELMSLGN